ncbi:MAG: DNA integrity scanning diadenylate cyclase DisA [Actinomycetota bacterium]|nr:DNA integrity scanning diadenylate cyclase DisA [Actinomycetota bacterium]
MKLPGSHLEDLLEWVVPGSPLRDGIERIRRARMGALVVLGDDPDVLGLCSGGFHVDVEMTPQRLSELAKMDGAIVLSSDARRIAWVNVHLIPDPSQPTVETGTRHRTAERVARTVDVPVVAVSEETGTITLYRGADRRQLGDSDSLVARANHLLAMLERFKGRYDDRESALTQAELAARVTVRDVISVLQRAETVVRVARTVSEVVAELGEEGQFLDLELNELVVDVLDGRQSVLRDYLDAGELARLSGRRVEVVVTRLEALSTEDLLVIDRVVAALSGEQAVPSLDDRIATRGLRLLARLVPLPGEVADRLAESIGGLDELSQVTVERLAAAAAVPLEDAAVVHAAVQRAVLGA